MRKIDNLSLNPEKVRGAIAIAGAAGMLTFMGITAGATDTVNTVNTENAESTENTVISIDDQPIEYRQYNTVKGSGRVVETNLEGHYFAGGVEGIAMTDQEWSLQRDAGMAMVEYFFVTTWDITQDTAPKAVNTFRIVAESEQAELGPIVQINIHKTFNGVMTYLDGNPAKFTTVVGIPEDFREDGARYAVVSVKSGGFFDILPDLDEDDLTLTFKANAGNGAYAIIRY